MLFPRVQQDNRVYATYTQVICQDCSKAHSNAEDHQNSLTNELFYKHVFHVLLSVYTHILSQCIHNTPAYTGTSAHQA